MDHVDPQMDLQFMRAALEEARLAARAGEVPVGAVVAVDGREIARASNRTLADTDPTAHAEIVALRRAAAVIGNHRLLDATLYVTIEPCVMCAGAMIQARIKRLVYGADDPKGGAVRSCFEVLSSPHVNHRIETVAGVLEEQCSGVLQEFFAGRR